jgi:hypothetical protein
LSGVQCADDPAGVQGALRTLRLYVGLQRIVKEAVSSQPSANPMCKLRRQMLKHLSERKKPAEADWFRNLDI